MADRARRKPRVLLTGGTGFLAINWACAMRDGWEVVLGTHRHGVTLKGVRAIALDLETPRAFAATLAAEKPDLIVHTAGLTDVDRCDADAEQARAINAGLARAVAAAAAGTGIRLAHISTDHLFAGDRPLCTEDEPPHPLNEYGRSKLMAEQWVRDACPDALLVRTNFFGWGHASRRSFTDWIIYNLREGRELSAFDDVFFTPILADRLAAWITDLATRGMAGIYNVCGDERLSKYAFARKVAAEFGLPAYLLRRSSIEGAGLRAARPRDMSLDNSKTRGALGRQPVPVEEDLRALHEQERAGRRDELLEAVTR